MSAAGRRDAGKVSDAQRGWARWALCLAPPLALAFMALAVWNLRLPGAPLEKALEAVGEVSAALLLACAALAARRELSGVEALPSSGVFLLFASMLAQISRGAAQAHHHNRIAEFIVEIGLFAVLWLLSAAGVGLFFHPPAQKDPAARTPPP